LEFEKKVEMKIGAEILYANLTIIEAQ